jgi:hypothetical protein
MPLDQSVYQDETNGTTRPRRRNPGGSQASEPPEVPPVDRDSEAAIAQAHQLHGEMSTYLKDSLSRLGGELGVLAARRERTKSDLVQALVYLHDPVALKSEAILEAAQILGLATSQEVEEDKVIDISFDELDDPYAEQVIDTHKYTFRAFAPASAAGCLPM